MGRFDTLFQEIEILGVRIPNRLMLPAINTGYTDPGNYVSDDLISFHETIAAGGIGLSVVGSTGVAKRGQVNLHSLMLHSEEHANGLERLFRCIEQRGSVPAIQLMHAGRQTRDDVIGCTPVGPSPIPCPQVKQTPKELTVDEIWEIEGQFAEAARRAVSVGAKIIEIHGAHGYLIAQFVSPCSNKRRDQYGGSLANRLRFPLEVIARVREVMGEAVPIMYRHSAEEFVEGGITLADSVTIAPILVAGGVNIVSVSAGTYASRSRIIPSRSYGAAVYGDLARAIKQAVEVPVAVAGNISDLQTAEWVITEGYADLVGIGRALIADPLLVRKTLDGRVEEIVRCTGCGVCDYGLRGEPRMSCPLNPGLPGSARAATAGGLLPSGRQLQ